MNEEKQELLFTLLKLSEEKEIPFTKRQLEKMTLEKLQLVFKQYKEKELDEFNETMTDVVISKMDELMKNRDWIKKDSKLGLKLQNKKLFRSDLKNVISYVSPMLPFIGFLEGVVTITGEVVEKMMEKEDPKKEDSEEEDPKKEDSEEDPEKEK